MNSPLSSGKLTQVETSRNQFLVIYIYPLRDSFFGIFAFGFSFLHKNNKFGFGQMIQKKYLQNLVLSVRYTIFSFLHTLLFVIDGYVYYTILIFYSELFQSRKYTNSNSTLTFGIVANKDDYFIDVLRVGSFIPLLYRQFRASCAADVKLQGLFRELWA